MIDWGLFVLWKSREIHSNSIKQIAIQMMDSHDRSLTLQKLADAIEITLCNENIPPWKSWINFHFQTDLDFWLNL